MIKEIAQNNQKAPFYLKAPFYFLAWCWTGIDNNTMIIIAIINIKILSTICNGQKLWINDAQISCSILSCGKYLNAILFSQCEWKITVSRTFDFPPCTTCWSNKSSRQSFVCSVAWNNKKCEGSATTKVQYIYVMCYLMAC